MRSKKAFLLAIIALTLISSANADLILTFNGLDTTNECPDIKGKDNLVIAVTGDTEIDPNACRIEAVGGVLEAKADSNTVGPQAYSFAFEGESTSGSVSLIVNNDMVIDGVSVKAGDTIYELVLFYFSETDTVTAFGFGMNLTSLNYVPPEPEPTPELNLQPEIQIGPVAELQPALELNSESTADSINSPQAEVYSEPEQAAEPQPKAFSPPSKQWPKRINKLKHFSEVSESLGFKDWKPGDANYSTKFPSFEAKIPAEFKTIDLTTGSAEAGTAGGFDMLTEGDEDYEVIPAGPLTENTIWDSNVILEGCVEVDNVMLVIKPGVEVRIINGNNGIVVKNNGCLIANGTPDEMINFFPTNRFPYLAYDCAIMLEETASPLCEISYCLLYCAIDGIYSSNKRLENPIHDNCFWDCMFGVRQFGPMLTDVVNNEIFNPTDPEMIALGEIFPAGIVARLDDACGVASNTAEIYISNNTISGNQSWGIYVSGVEDPNDAGTVTIANNLIAGTRGTAISLVNGWMRSLVICNGFYANYQNMYGTTEENEEMAASGGGASPEPLELLGEDSNTVRVVENFNTYAHASYPNRLRDIWINPDTPSPCPHNGAEVLPVSDPNLNGPPYWSMRYKYDNNESPYYSEVEASTADLPSEIGSDWTIGDVNTLTLYFYGQFSNDAGEQMYVKLTDGDNEDFYVVDNFNKVYNASTNRMRDTWKDGSTQSEPKTNSQVQPKPDPSRSGSLCKSMEYAYDNNESPYYSEVRADVGTGGKKLYIDPDWLDLEFLTLSLWFYGKPTNDANEQMYIQLVDNDNPDNNFTSYYSDCGDMNDIREEKWHQWNIPLWDFDRNVNMADVNQIIIGFGEEDETPGGTGIVYFEDIHLSKVYPPLPHTAKVLYDGIPYRLIEDWWHVWNIPFTELSGVDMTNVKSIAIGFGDGNAPYSNTGTGTVYFDDIILGNGSAEDPFYDGSVELDKDPFVNGYLDWPLLLKPECPLIDAGAGYIDEYPYLLGKTTGFHPDTNVANIGFHYFLWNYVNAAGTMLTADLNNDLVVNFGDFAILAERWLTICDMNDLDIIADQWLETSTGYPPIAITVSGDANTGFVEIDANGYSSDTQRIFLLADGQYAGEIAWFRGGEPFMLDVSALGPGTHQLKAVGVDDEGLITCSSIRENTFNCFLNYCRSGEVYDPNEPHSFRAFYSGSGDISAKVYNEDDGLVWTQTYPADNICGFIPAGITLANDLDYIVFEEDSPGGMMLLSGSGSSRSVTKPLTITFDPGKVNSNIRALLILPNFWVNLFNDVDNVVRDAFESHGVEYYELAGSNATYENLSWFAHNRYIRYIYYAGHGSDGTERDKNGVIKKEYFGEGVRRTVIGLADCKVVSAKNSDFPEGTAPSWCVPIKGERGYRSIYELKDFLPGELKLVHLDCCYSGRLRLSSTELIEVTDPYNPTAIPESDMSWAFNMKGTDTYGQICQGWWGEKYVKPGQSNYETFGVIEWTHLKDGDDLGKALHDTLSDPCVAGEISSQHLSVSGGGLITGVKIED